jgi:hypothetical protein
LHDATVVVVVVPVDVVVVLALVVVVMVVVVVVVVVVGIVQLSSRIQYVCSAAEYAATKLPVEREVNS